VVTKLKGTWAFPAAFSILWFAVPLFFPFTWGNITMYQNFVVNAYLWLLAGVLFRLPTLVPARTVIEDRHPKGEGFGIVYLEAMAFGKPVIGPNYGAPVELIRHGENGLLVSPEDPAAVSDALLRLLADPASARAMGESGGRWVNQHYSYDCFRERLRQALAA
jgi:glycosyltransferase involved in cell wall biosynthesis